MATTMSQPQMRTTGQRLPVNVTVELHDDNPHHLKYNLVSGSPGELPIDTIKYKGKDEIKLSFNNNQNGSTYDGFEITFTMSDLTGKGYGFFFTDPKRPEEAFWAKSVDSAGSCPTTQSSLPHIKAKFVDRNTLVVVNPNGHLEYFGFALALSKAGETAPSVIIDPIGDNQDSQLNVNLGTGGIG
jgi:hypothetical protein